MKKEKKPKTHNFFAKLFSKYFGFESGVDITDEVALLVRRNFVIKNIVAVSNMFYTVLFLVLSILNPKTATNWIFMILSTALTFAVNMLLKKLASDKKDITKQYVAMYVSTLYIFLSSVLVYAKTSTAEVDMETGGYILILYSLVVISLYQDKKILANSFLMLLLGITVVHMTITYDISQQFSTIMDFLNKFFASPQFADILLRTIVFIVFFFVVYVIVSIGQYIQEERKKELIKRREVQNDFSNIVSDLFSVVFSASHTLLDEKHAKQVSNMAIILARDFGLKDEEISALNDYAIVHLEYDKIKAITQNEENEINYDKLRDNTELGSLIAKRVQLAQKCEDITRAHIEGTNSKEFLDEMLKIQPEIISQIILLSDLYITMRNATPYKRPLSHKTVITQFQGDLAFYFDYNLKERFLRFNADFEKIYNEF